MGTLNRYHSFLNAPMESVCCELVPLACTLVVHYSKKIMESKSW
jgi:hypothetical protein